MHRSIAFVCLLLAPATFPSVATAADLGAFPITDPTRPPRPRGLGHEPDVKAAFNTPTILFVNFDGGQMNGGCGDYSKDNCSTIIQGMMSAYPGDASARASVIQSVREDVVDFGVIVLGERPPESQPYAMVMVGLPNGQDPGQVGGVAPSIDCSNSDPNETSFAFLVDSGSNVLATVIHQEAAHTWGLEHVDSPSDNMHPSAGGVLNPTYRDECSQCVSDTDLNPSGGICNMVHTQFCSSGQQNSYQEMLLLFGPPVPDTISPTVVIDEPADGAVLGYEDTWDLVITLDDDRRPQTLQTQISFDGTMLIDDPFINTTLSFPVNGGDPPTGHGLANGPHTIRVDITDEWGNPGSDEITIVIENGPEGQVDESGSGGVEGGSDDGSGEAGEAGESGSTSDLDRGNDEGCSCRSRGGAAGLALPLLLLVGRRRPRGSLHGY